MKRVWHLSIVVLIASVIGLAAPHSTQAAVSSMSILGDCSHVEIQLSFSGADGAYQNTLISAETAFGGLAGKYIDVPASNSISTSLSWGEVPRGTVITVIADHYIAGQGVSAIVSKSYTCGDPVSGGIGAVYAPETNDRVMITATMPVYGGTDLGMALPGMQVEPGQEFLMVDSVVADDITWFQIFIGGAYPWVPDLGAYSTSN